MKTYLEKVVITDDPATWPEDGATIYEISDDDDALWMHKFDKTKIELVERYKVDVFWLKPVNAWGDEDMEKAFEAGNKRGWSGYPNTDNWTEPTFKEYINNLKNQQK